VEAQFSKVYGILVKDFDKDGVKDIFLAGNFYPYRVQLGRCDASLGVLMKGKSNNVYEAVPQSKSGLYVDGEVRRIVSLKNEKKQSLIVMAKNNDNIQIIKEND
jgi:enediyne biosynthesis protein E4